MIDCMTVAAAVATRQAFGIPASQSWNARIRLAGVISLERDIRLSTELMTKNKLPLTFDQVVGVLPRYCGSF